MYAQISLFDIGFEKLTEITYKVGARRSSGKGVKKRENIEDNERSVLVGGKKKEDNEREDEGRRL